MKKKFIYLAVLSFAGLFLMATDVCAQSPSEGAGKPAESSAPAVKNKTLWEQIVQGGWVMFPIAGLSVVTVYFIADGIMRTMPKKVAPVEHENAVKALFQMGDYVGAYNYCKANSSPLNDVLRVGISLLGDGKEVAEEGMAGEIAKQNANMQTYISYLSVVGVCAPMVGLLGTVTGMIGAFSVLGNQGISDPGALSAKIGEVLVATASGLIIAIPAFMAFYYLRNRAMNAIHHIQEVINRLFRKMPYASLEGVRIGDEEIYAAEPNWNVSGEADGAHAATA